MFNKGVFFGDPQDGADRQKEILLDYYRSLLREQIDWFRKSLDDDPDSLFEVGSSVGWYMKVACDEFLTGGKMETRGPLVQGCDANKYAAELARKGFGLDVRGCTFQNYAMSPEQRGRFALAAMLDYIEHSYTPLDDLKKLHEMVMPGGILLLKTFLEELDKGGAYVHTIFHAHHFTERTLRRALEDAGWKPLLFDMERERSLALVTVFAERL